MTDSTFRLAFLLAAVLPFGWSCGAPPPAEISGELQRFHGVALTFDGPEASEDGDPNPFTDYRLEVIFRSGEGSDAREVRVPGFYAADGEAAETSAKQGGKWRARFAPPAAGEWSYEASFRTAPGIATSDDPEAGEPTAFDGSTGSFTVAESDKRGPDHRAKGFLRYVGGHHLRFDSGEYFLKGGADSPENFLAYEDFDDTFDTDVHEGVASDSSKFIHAYAPHADDWREGDPTWKGDKGKNIIGALNYLASKGMNSVYFLTYNLDGGDGKDTWMWTAPDVRDRFDASKLDQWEIVFSHMDRLGVMLHVITQETENDRALGGGAGLNDVRKLYLRELVARFAHHPAIMWNLGEENNTPDADRQAIAGYIRGLDPYDHPITVHTHNKKALTFYDGILGSEFFEASSIQGEMAAANAETIEMRKKSREAGRPWAIFHDEQAPASTGAKPDADDPTHDDPRKLELWGNLMGGGAGVEWYFGYEYDHMDLNAEDWRSRDRLWDQTRHALEFFRAHLPFWEMEPANDKASASGAYVLAKEGEVHAVYLPGGGTTRLTLPDGEYSVEWYDPRNGGELQTGSVASVQGGGAANLGAPPAERRADWAVLVRKR